MEWKKKNGFLYLCVFFFIILQKPLIKFMYVFLYFLTSDLKTNFLCLFCFNITNLITKKEKMANAQTLIPVSLTFDFEAVGSQWLTVGASIMAFHQSWSGDWRNHIYLSLTCSVTYIILIICMISWTFKMQISTVSIDWTGKNWCFICLCRYFRQRISTTSSTRLLCLLRPSPGGRC